MYRGVHVAVVVPAHNLADRICDTISAVPAFVDRIIIVDDGSHDGTAALARSVSSPGLQVIAHETNCGVGAAIETGYHQALASGADLIAVMAGDGQMDPRDLAGLLDPLVSEQCDYTKGNRFLHPSVWREMPLARILGNLVLSVCTRVCVGVRVFDSQCGYTAARKQALLAIGPRLWPRYGYPNELLARLQEARQRVRDVPVRAIYNGSPSGVYWFTAIYPIGWLLVRALGRRVARFWAPSPIRALRPRV